MELSYLMIRMKILQGKMYQPLKLINHQTIVI
nr:MAG TPA: hypothetical protein [Caudoviricetes sp.]